MALDSSVPSTIVVGNSVHDTPLDPFVPQFLEDSSELVQHYLALNEDFAQAAFSEAKASITALQTAIFPNNLPNPPDLDDISVALDVEAGLGFDTAPNVPTLQTQAPPAFSPAAIDIPSVEDEIPVYVPLITGISIPDPPTVTPVIMPVAPTIDTEFDDPVAPVADYGASPTLTEYPLPIFIPPVLPLFDETVPTMSVEPPNPVIQWAEPVYQSDIQDQVKIVLGIMLEGGTGLPPAVELAIWERGREREDARGEQEINAAIAQWATRNFSHPPGQLNKQIIVLRDATGLRINDLSREVMVKQADLEQKNRQFAVEKAIDYERVFTAIFLAVVERNFQIAKLGVETQIQIYNLAVTAFNVEQQIFAQQVLLYRTQVEAALSEIKVFEAQVGAVKAGAELNVALTQAFSEKVKAYVAQVEAYEALIKGEVAKSDLQKNKVDIYKVQVDAAVAEISAQHQQFLAYDSMIKGETSKVQLEEANTRAYTAQVQAIGEKANIIIKEADARIQQDRLNLDWAIAAMRRIEVLNGQQVSLAQTSLAHYEAVNRKAIAKFEADLKGEQASLQHQIEVGRLSVARFDALSQQWRSRVTEIIQMAEINAQSMRSAGQIAGNLAAGAMAATHVSAGLSAGATAAQNTSRQVSDHTGHTEAYNSGYNVNHQYDHKV